MTELLQEAVKDHDNEQQPERAEIMPDVQDGPTIIENPNAIEGKDLRSALRDIFSNKNYTTFLLTAWVFSTFNYLSSYLNLYLKIMGWSIITIGVVMSIVTASSSINRLIGGYMGDVANRKHIATAAFFVMGVYYIIVGLFVDFWMIFLALMVYSIHDLFRSGSSAYIMENVPNEHSGFALSLFTAGRGLSIIGLIVLGIFEPILGFTQAFRTMYFITGLALIIASGARAYLLDSCTPKNSRKEKPLLTEFLSENARAAKLLMTAIPGLILVVMLDTISDSFFKFIALIYTYEVLEIELAGINFILIAQLAISVPLLLKMGRVSDRKGIKRAAMVVYSIMPFSALLLYVAPMVPYVVPEEIVLSVNSMVPGLGVALTTPFIGIVLKYVNDSLWWGLIIILIRKRLPETDTSKILSIFWVLVYVLSSVGPVIAGIIYEFVVPSMIFLAVFVLNIGILLAIAKGPFGNGAEPAQTSLASSVDSE